MRWTLLLALALPLLAIFPAALAQDAVPPKPAAQVSFHFELPGLEVPKFTLTVNEDGSARYEAEVIFAAARGSESAPAPQQIDRQVTLSVAMTRQIFASARDLNRFTDVCESKAKNIADTGRKTLRYTGDGGDGRCEYNYSQDRRITLLTDTFQAIAATLDMGRKLDFDHRFDRLGLDAESALLVEQAGSGRAIELGTIAPTLRSLAQDSEVMERVRSRAAKLLLMVPPTS